MDKYRPSVPSSKRTSLPGIMRYVDPFPVRGIHTSVDLMFCHRISQMTGTGSINII
jgi:hypothetical protein